MDVKRIIRIGTRESKLALWQANLVKDKLEALGLSCILVPVKSEGDLDLVTPLYAMGVEGVFTKTLDAHLLSDKIDLAVHSMKDVPVQLAEGIVQAAVLKRGSHKDILVARSAQSIADFSLAAATIATGSIRRKAQWLHRYPAHHIENLRGNVQTRLQKLQDNNWDGAIFAAAGLERLDISVPHRIDLDWMLPAPAQGAIMVVCRQHDQILRDQCQEFNDNDTALCVQVERDFLSALMGGCSTPISALAVIENNEIRFQGNILSPDGAALVAYNEKFPIDKGNLAGNIAAGQILKRGGDVLISKMKNDQQ